MNVKKKLLASLALAALAFCAMSAPIPSYRVATNIADAVSRTVVSNTVTRSYIEGLVSGSGGLVNATDIINDITRDSTQATLINRTDGHEDNAIVTIGSVDKQSNLAGLMTVEDKETLDSIVYNLASKADKAAPSAANNLAALTADGDLADSGKKPSDFRETTDNICHKNQLGNVWTCDPPLPEGYEIVRYSDGYGWEPELNGHPMGIGKYDTNNTATTLSWAANEWQGGYAFTATRTTVAKSGESFVTEGSISTNNPAFVSAVQNTPTSGMPDDIPTDWGTYGTVGAAMAALASAVTWLKKNKVGSFAPVGGASATVENGVAKLDDFFTNSNSLLNARITYKRNATGLKDRAFNTLSFDGTEYNLSTALAAVTPTASGQPRDLLIVATATAATTIGFTAGTIKGDKPTIDGSGTWLITLTEYASGVWYCRQIKMEDAA